MTIYHALFYETTENYVEKRKPYREQHLAMVETSSKNGSLILGGAFDNPADQALLIFKGESPEVAETFAQNDPYVKNGLITRWWIRRWKVVIENV